MPYSRFFISFFSQNSFLLIAFALLSLRWMAVLMSPLTLGADEAQYWLWGQRFDFGYFSKPPLIAWLIGISHGLFGHEVWAIRLPAAPFHIGTAFVLHQLATRLFAPSAGWWVALFWLFSPLAAMGSFVISTDTPLLFFWSLALMLLVNATNPKSATGEGTFNRRDVFLAGAALGFGMLSKYAAIYFFPGLFLWMVWARPFSVAIAAKLVGFFTLGFLAITSPNLIWNINNGFVTVAHLADNANLAQPDYQILSLLAFWVSQFGVVGPLLFVLIVIAAFKPSGHKKLLISIAVPAMLVISAQAFVNEANANWAVVAYPSLMLILSGYLAQGGKLALRAGAVAVCLNVLVSLIFLAVVTAGSFGPLAPKSDPLRRLKGWPLLAADIDNLRLQTGAKTILADRRDSAAMLNWYFFDTAVSIRVFDRDGYPANHYEMVYPFVATSLRPVIAISEYESPELPETLIWQGPLAISEHRISEGSTRRKYLFLGRDK